jgi:hypothetical protein
MPTIAFPLGIADFAAGLSINWGQWDLPIQIVDNDLPFLTDNGPNPHCVLVGEVQLPNHDTYVDRGSGLRRGFVQADRLLIAHYQKQSSAIHLHFDPPIRALGTCMSADGALGESFLAQIEVEDPVSGARCSQSVASNFSSVVGAAPFVGLQGGPGEVIHDAWFDVKTEHTQALERVAINQLLILP